jgi:hypothetical protein
MELSKDYWDAKQAFLKQVAKLEEEVAAAHLKEAAAEAKDEEFWQRPVGYQNRKSHFPEGGNRPTFTNPYDAGSVSHRDWARGFIDGRLGEQPMSGKPSSAYGVGLTAGRAVAQNVYEGVAAAISQEDAGENESHPAEDEETPEETEPVNPYPTSQERADKERAEGPWMFVAQELKRLAKGLPEDSRDVLVSAAWVVEENAPWGGRE